MKPIKQPKGKDAPDPNQASGEEWEPYKLRFLLAQKPVLHLLIGFSQCSPCIVRHLRPFVAQKKAFEKLEKQPKKTPPSTDRDQSNILDKRNGSVRKSQIDEHDSICAGMSENKKPNSEKPCDTADKITSAFGLMAPSKRQKI